MTQKDDTPVSGPDSDATERVEAYCSACNQSFTPDHVWCPNDGALLVKLKAAKDLLLGRVFEGRYQIRSALGEGGMGTVYRGLQLSLDREVAIKVIHAKLASDRTTAKRFLREARLSSRLNQPNIVNVYEFGQTDDGILYLVMELLKGRSLHHVIESQFLELDRIQRIGLQLCDALEAAHNQGIVHRDLKPGNIVILDEPAGRDLLKVLDFGLAKSLVNDTSNITNTNALMGTPLYMSPEQIEGRASDQRSDLYSLGCILYQMLTGRPPFVGETINAILAAHVRDQPAPLSERVPAELTAMMARMLAKNPDDRVGSAAEIRDALSMIDVSRGLAPRVASRPEVSAQVASTDRAYSAPVASSLEVGSSQLGQRRRPWLLLLLLPLVVGGGIFAVAKFLRTPAAVVHGADAPPALEVAADATRAATEAGTLPVDAGVDAPADAAAPVHDATRPPRSDAGVRPGGRVPHRVDAAVHRDAGLPMVDAAAAAVVPNLPDAGVRPDARFVEPELLSTKRDAGGPR